MLFASLIMFVLMYYIRPQEWYGFLVNLRPIQLTMIIGIWGLLTHPRKLKARDFFRTPHDWLMFSYLGWAILTSQSPTDTFKACQSIIMTYIICVQALDNVKRMKTFLSVWTLCIVFLAVMAVASEYGFDPLNTYDKTHGLMKDRLILNLSVFNNPNALAHNVAPVIPMIFYLFWWKKVATKIVAAALAFIALWCVYLTQSKGGFLVSFSCIVATLSFGRSKVYQIVILAIAGTVGISSVYLLPRMNELDKTKTDGAIQGRVAAFTFGRKMLSQSWTGVGMYNFGPSFFHRGPMERVKQKNRPHQPFVFQHYKKASHSSYNQNGSELGYPGFTLLIALLYSSFRTLIAARTANSDEERIRRMLFVLVLSYTISSWMVDFAYRPTFFLIIGSTAAFHRHLAGVRKRREEEEKEDAQPMVKPLNSPLLPMPAMRTAAAAGPMTPSPAFPGSGQPRWLMKVLPPPGQAPRPKPGLLPVREVEPEQDSAQGTIAWVRFSMFDVVMSIMWMEIAVRIWDHAIKSM